MSARKRLAVGVSIPAVVLFVGFLVALMLPSNLFVMGEALDGLGFLGGRRRIEGLLPVPPSPPPPLRFVNGKLWDAAGGLRDNTGLATRDGLIAQEASPGERIIDVSGMTILPGLIDMHVHALGGTFADEMMIGNGVTSARDLGSHLEGILARRDSATPRPRPRLFVTGPYLISQDTFSDQDVGAPDAASAAEVVERFAEAGVDGIKVHTGIDRETLETVVRKAHERGLWVAAHLGPVDAVEAAETGVDTIEHASGIEWDGDAADGDLVATLVSHGVAVTPTLVVAEHAFTIRSLSGPDNPMLEYFPWMLRRAWIVSQLANASAGELDPQRVRMLRERLDRIKRFTGSFHHAGGRILAGTDSPAFLVAPGFDMHRELELLVESGLGVGDALAAATREAAAALGRASDLGGLAPGMRADLIVIDGDPFSHPRGISVTRRLVLVVKDGHIVLDRLQLTSTGGRSRFDP